MAKRHQTAADYDRAWRASAKRPEPQRRAGRESSLPPDSVVDRAVAARLAELA